MPLQVLRKMLPPETPILGCSGGSILGVSPAANPAGMEMAYEKEGPIHVTVLLGHLPNCRAHVFAADDSPFRKSTGGRGDSAGPFTGVV